MPEPDDWDFTGLYIPTDDAFELWQQWEHSGVMPEPGGYFDQPHWWRHLVHAFRRIYQIKAWQVRAELRDRRNG